VPRRYVQLLTRKALPQGRVQEAEVLCQRVEGQDQEILAARHTLYTKARELNPARWSGKTRNWSPTDLVNLNPERDDIVRSCSDDKLIQQLAA
jgi:hypothetical protein